MFVINKWAADSNNGDVFSLSLTDFVSFSFINNNKSPLSNRIAFFLQLFTILVRSFIFSSVLSISVCLPSCKVRKKELYKIKPEIRGKKTFKRKILMGRKSDVKLIHVCDYFAKTPNKSLWKENNNKQAIQIKASTSISIQRFVYLLLGPGVFFSFFARYL